MALVGEVLPEGDMTPKILPVPLPHHPSLGSLPGWVKMAFSPFFFPLTQISSQIQV